MPMSSSNHPTVEKSSKGSQEIWSLEPYYGTEIGQILPEKSQIEVFFSQFFFALL